MTVVTFYILSYVAIFSFYDPTIFRLVYILDLIFLADTSYRVTLEVSVTKSYNLNKAHLI